jgi:hypothetical protein
MEVYVCEYVCDSQRICVSVFLCLCASVHVTVCVCLCRWVYMFAIISQEALVRPLYNDPNQIEMPGLFV